MNTLTLAKTSTAIAALCAAISTFAANPPLALLNDPIDISGDFRDYSSFYYLADRLAEFDPAVHAGKITYQRARYHVRHAFDNDLQMLETTGGNEFPENQYAVNPALPFSIDFVSPRALRIRMTSGPQVHSPPEELMLAGDVPKDDSWKYEKISGGHRYTSAAGSVTIRENPFHIELRDANGKLLTQTDHNADNSTSSSCYPPQAEAR